MRRISIEDFIEQNAKYFVGYERESEITRIATEIMADGIKEKDAFHIASAIYSGCEYFISTDKRLLRFRTDKIRLVSPVEFISELEAE
ncbi:MAG: PIN domain-containing protein [Lachnospiraceae bacterium]|nr:PIN domain-containing protein [Lachnospiraceae bacterium]